MYGRTTLHTVLTLSLLSALILAPSRPVSAQPEFIRGDCNGDQDLGIADPITLLTLLFSGGAVGCDAACDANDDGLLNLGDAIYLLSAIFSGDDAPSAPYPSCGADPTPDTLSCLSTPCPSTPPGPSANLREVDVAYLGVTPSGTGQLVSITGSGAQHQLTSWSLAAAAGQPTAQVTTPPIDGHHPQIVRLSGLASLAGNPPFATATIRDDGNVWVSSRALNASGSFTHYGTVGYGENADVEVLSYDLVMRPIYSGFFLSEHQIVTAVVVEPTGGGPTTLRIVSWSIDAATGALTGLEDSGDLPVNFPQTLTPDEAAVSVSHLNGIQYVLNFTNDADHLANHFFWVEDDGDIVYGGGASGGMDIRGTGTVSIDQEASAVARVTASGFISANRDFDGTLSMSVWERRADGFLNWEPYHLTDNGFDLAPDSQGMYLSTPQLTDSWRYRTSTSDFAADTVATGDFNGDGYDDAVIGVPYRDFDGIDNVGAAYVIHGHSGEGVTGQPYTREWTQNSPAVVGAPEANDRFGEALAVGDFDGDGNDDIAIGVPLEDVGAISNAGAVNIIMGSPFGLTTTGNFIVTQDDLGYTSAASDYFGFALTAGDYDGDGYDDLAASAYGRDVGGHPNGGVVYVLWGSSSGLSTSGSTLLHQDSAGIFETVEDFDEFGRTLTTGDFNGNGSDDLVVGVPHEDVGAQSNAGGVHVFYGNGGSTTGFSGNNFISQGGFSSGDDIHGAVEAGDEFGSALAAGDFDDDGADDLAIGVPGESVGALASSGAVNVLYGTFFGLTHINNVIITQDEFNPIGGTLPATAEAGDTFGSALTTGDFDGDGYADLIVSAPDKDLPATCGSPAVTDAGAVFEIFGSNDGLVAAGSTLHHQNSCQGSYVANGSSDPGDEYGSSLAAADFNADGACDLLVGIPYSERDDQINVGSVHILPGSDTGLDYSVDEEFFLRLREVVRGRVSDLTWENAGGTGSGSLYSEGAFLDTVHVASVAKVMTLLLAVEAIEAGTIDTLDMVNVSDLAGGTGGSFLEQWDEDGPVLDGAGDEIRFIQFGDSMPLDLLLHGMMMRSGNRCSVAIGEYVAQEVTGDADDFVDMMNDRAAELGLTETVCGHPAGGMITQTQDLITLLREGWNHALFRQIIGTELYGDTLPDFAMCGTTITGVEKCNSPFPKFMTIGEYPGRLGWKGGNGGLWWDAQPASGIPWCTSSAVAVVERAGRPFAMSLMQTGDRVGDSQTLLDHGVRKVFTPDRLATLDFPTVGGLVGPDGPIRVRAYAIDAIEDDVCVTAIIDDYEELRLNVWSTDFETGDVYSMSTATETYTLPDGTTYAPTPLVRISRVPSGNAIGDYLTANLEGEHLELELWRVGEAP